MARGAVVGRLRAILSADTTQFQTGMRRAEKRLSASQKAMREASKAAQRFAGALGAVVSAGALLRLGGQAIQFSKDIANASDKLGVNVETLQEWVFAAKQFDVQQSAAVMGLQRFIRRVAEAQAGTGELLGIIKAYDIELFNANGTTRKAEQILRDYADAIKNAGSDQERLRLAFKGFDSEGAALVSVLKQGGAGLEEMSRRARDLGQVLDVDTIQRLRDASVTLDNFATSTKIFVGEAIGFWAELAEKITAVSKSLDALPGASGNGRVYSRFLPEIAELRSEEERLELFKKVQSELKVASDALLDGNAASRGNAGFFSQEMRERLEASISSYRLILKQLQAANFDFSESSTTAAPNRSTGKSLDLLKNGITSLREERKSIASLLSADALDSSFSFGITAASGELASAISSAEDSLRELEQPAKQVPVWMSEAADGVQTFAYSLENALANAAANGKASFGDMAQFILAEINRILIRVLVLKPLFAGIGGALGGTSTTLGSAFINAFGGERASGGPVSSGKAYLVGERGPELFSPSQNGTILPNGMALAGASASGGGTYYIDARGADRQGFNQLAAMISQLNGSIEKRAVAAVADIHKRKPGYLSR